MKKNFTCIICPLGCNLEIELNNNEIIVKGNQCEKGKRYAEDEFKNPKRVLTTTVKVKNGKYRMIPVKTTKPIPKSYIFPLLKILSQIELEAPIPQGYKVLEDIFGEDVDVITTRPMERKDISKNPRQKENNTSKVR
ncbi:MAG: DUF1667 domain-containing protein [Dictyoglomus sp.]